MSGHWSRLALLLSCLAAALFGVGSTSAQSIAPEASLGKSMEIITTVRIAGQPKPVDTQMLDIGVGGDDVVWAVSANGVFRKRGLTWEHVPSFSTSFAFDPLGGELVSHFQGALRVDVSPDGIPWVIDDTKTLQVLSEDKNWLRRAGHVRDVAVGGLDVWYIPEADAPILKQLAAGEYLVNLTRNSVTAIPAKYGKAIAIDVSARGVPYVATSSGFILHYSPETIGNWIELDGHCTGMAGSKDEDCDPTRKPEDIAVSGDMVWVTGTGKDKTGYTFLHSNFKLTGLSPFLKLAPGSARVASDSRGNLYTIDAKGRAGFANLALGYKDSGKVLNAALMAVLLQPQKKEMRAFALGTPALERTLTLPGDLRLLDALSLRKEFTMSVLLAQDGDQISQQAMQCVLSVESLGLESWSLCIEGGTSLVLTVDGLPQNHPIDLSTTKTMGMELVRKLLVQVKDRKLTILTNVTTEIGKPALVTTVFEGQMPAIPGSNGDQGNKLIIGSRSGGADPFRGHIGSLRMWNAAVPLNEIQANPQTAVAGDLTLPGLDQLVLEALVYPDTKALAPVDFIAREPRVAAGGLWWSQADGGLTTVDLGNQAIAVKGGLSLPRPQIFKIVSPPKSGAFEVNRLDIYRDGEGGMRATSFEQSERNIYLGWQDPRTGKAGAEPFQIEVFPDNTIILRDPNRKEGQEGQEEIWKRLDDSIQSNVQFDGNPPSSVGASLSLFTGHDIRNLARIPREEKPGNLIFDPGPGFNAAAKSFNGKLPPGVNYRKADFAVVANDTRIIETTRELQNDRSRSYGGSIEVPSVFSFSADAKFKNSVKNMAEAKTMRAVSEGWWANFVMRAHFGRLPLAANFIADVQKVRDGKLKLTSLISNYGTHYANGVLYGARARAEKFLDESALEEVIGNSRELSAEGGLTIKGVEIGLKAAMEDSKEATKKDSTSKETSNSEVLSASLAFDSEEQTVGDDENRSQVIAMDLRPLSDLLSPVYFDDPAIHTDLRYELAQLIGITLMKSAMPQGLSDESLLPKAYAVKIERIEGKNIAKGGFGGTMTWRKPGKNGEERKVTFATPATVTDESQKNIIKPSDIIVIADAQPDGRPGTLSLSARVTLNEAGQEELTREITVDLGRLANGVGLSDGFTLVGKNCQCMTACPAGFEDVEGACRSTCPAGMDQTATTCSQVTRGEHFLDWEEDECERLNPSTGCERIWEVVLPFYSPKCKPGMKRMWSNVCSADCSLYGLERKKLLGDETTLCNRKEVPRSKTGRSANNACAADSVPGTDCVRVEVEYSIIPVALDTSR